MIHFIKKPVYIPTREERLREESQSKQDWLFIKAYLVFVLAFFLLVASGVKAHRSEDKIEKKPLSPVAIHMPTVVLNKEIIWTQAMEDKRILAEKARQKAKIAHVGDTNVPKKKIAVAGVIVVKQDDSYDVYALANAVAKAETG